jgi:hypothetical protein
MAIPTHYEMSRQALTEAGNLPPAEQQNALLRALVYAVLDLSTTVYDAAEHMAKVARDAA